VISPFLFFKNPNKYFLVKKRKMNVNESVLSCFSHLKQQKYEKGPKWKKEFFGD